MKTHPILFNGQMIRALLRNEKTQTRRVIKPSSHDIEKNDLLWVRETFADMEQAGEDSAIVYRATDTEWMGYEGWTWTPSIFLPRKLSRITLKVTRVCLEKLQDITNADARAEGIRHGPGAGNYTDERDIYRELWDSINAKNGHSWDKNELIRVIEFEVIQENIDEYLEGK